MSTPTVAIIGAGAAGTSAARALRAAGIDADLFTRTGQRPFNRMLVNKGVATGLIEPDQAVLPDPGATVHADTVRGLDPRTRELHLDSGASRAYDALIIASGSRPRVLDESIVGRDQATGADRLTTLHSLADATRVRNLVAAHTPARVLMLGGGLVASETASLLTDDGHDVAMITRSPLPGMAAIGEHAARRLLDLHRPQHAAYLGRTPVAIRTQGDRVTIVLDDGTRAEGDLAIVAHGTMPSAPAPWTGPEGIAVDSRMRVMIAPQHCIYAAGGVAVHHYPRHGAYRIDHWDDSTAQGAHAAAALLHDHGLGDDPGTYLPTSPFTARIHGHTLTGVGHPALGTSTRVISTEPLLVAHLLDETPVALTGIDATRLLHEWAPQLHHRITIDS